MRTGATAEVRQLLGDDILTELDALSSDVSTLSGLRDVVLDIVVIAVVVVATVTLRSIWLIPFSVVYIGIRQRHLSNLGHELVHAKLVDGQRANGWIGAALMFALGEPFKPYRRSHLRHHSRLGKPGDPMLESYIEGGAIEPQRGLRSFFLSVYLPSALWRLPVEAVLRWAQRGEDESQLWRLSRVGCSLAAVTAAFALGFGWLLLIYWIVPLVFVRTGVTWLTDLGNHAGLITNSNPLLQTRGWTSGWLTRHMLGGHLDDMYHPVHHLCPQIPWRHLPKAEAILRDRLPEWDSVPWCSGFFFRRRTTPDCPCVLEDILARTR